MIVTVNAEPASEPEDKTPLQSGGDVYFVGKDLSSPLTLPEAAAAVAQVVIQEEILALAQELLLKIEKPVSLINLLIILKKPARGNRRHVELNELEEDRQAIDRLEKGEYLHGQELQAVRQHLCYKIAKLALADAQTACPVKGENP